MQALTVAVGIKGIDFFVKQALTEGLLKTLGTLKPPDKVVALPDFLTETPGLQITYSNVRISLTNGKLSDKFSPKFDSVTQQAGGKFALQFSASDFQAIYSWEEKGHGFEVETDGLGNLGRDFDFSNDFDYRPGVGKLAATITVNYTFSDKTNSWDVDVVETSGEASGMIPNIPGDSVVQSQYRDCFSSHVDAATASSIAAIDFASPIKAILPTLIRSIPASGQLTDDITYEFGLGDSGLTFPGDKGIAIGATGKVKYKGTYYDGPAPTPPPVPPAPTDDHHLQMYVSDYEINALHWAFFKAGLLDVTVTPGDLPDPDALKVKTYVTLIPAFKPYAAFAMKAIVRPKSPPTATFQVVWEFTHPVLALLKSQLPSSVWTDAVAQAFAGNAYVAQADLEADLAGASVDQQYFPKIEAAAKSTGMAVAQALAFTLEIENGATAPPNLVFDLVRTDVLGGLALGISGAVQTMKYTFEKVKAAATLVSTTVPKFDKADFGSTIWPVAGEPRYEDALEKMGKTGVPLPIMRGFQFLFDQAQLSIQQGYVSILANVQFKPKS